jgi:hypothetical protein
MFIRKGGINLHDYTVSQLKRPHYSGCVYEIEMFQMNVKDSNYEYILYFVIFTFLYNEPFSRKYIYRYRLRDNCWLSDWLVIIFKITISLQAV